MNRTLGVPASYRDNPPAGKLIYIVESSGHTGDSWVNFTLTGGFAYVRTPQAKVEEAVV